MLREGGGRVAKEQIGARAWLRTEASCWPHPGLGNRLGVQVVAVVASNCSIGIQPAAVGPLPAIAKAEEVLTAG